jgi:hypothetical protein
VCNLSAAQRTESGYLLIEQFYCNLLIFLIFLVFLIFLIFLILHNIEVQPGHNYKASEFVGQIHLFKAGARQQQNTRGRT